MKDSPHLQPGAIEAAEALRWWIRAGVDCALGETPHDRFADSATAARRGAAVAPAAALERVGAGAGHASPVRQSAAQVGPPEAAETQARALAAAATDLETLKSLMANFDGCALKRTATQLVFADGEPGSSIMFVGEAPGGDEDRIGRPFVGRAGQLLDRMLNAVGLDRRQVYIANVIPWRPPGNRTPTLQETQTCLPFITRQIELADPRAPGLSRRLLGSDPFGRQGRNFARARLVVHLSARERPHDSRRWRCFIPPTCFVSPHTSGWPGPICALLPALLRIRGARA